VQQIARYYQGWCTSKARKYKKCKHNAGHDDFLLNCSIGWKKHTAYCSPVASRLSQALLQESFTSKWWLSSKVETWNFTKYKLFTFRFKSEHNFSETKAR